MLRRISVLMLFVLFTLAISTASAHDDSVADGLNSPRGIAYDAAGNLYIAEAGVGGELQLPGPDGTQATAGLSGQVTMVAPDGTKTVLIPNLPSGAIPEEGASGPYSVMVTDDAIWLVMTNIGPMLPYSGSVIAFDRQTMYPTAYIPVFNYEALNNPDGNDIDSNPADIAMGPDGKLYIVDAGGNDVLTWTREDGLQTLMAWQENPVPTSIAFDASGDIYIGFLGAGIVPGMGRIEHWSADGKTLVETFSNLTAVTDILIDPAGTLYAAQLVTFGEQGPMPDSGSVIKVSADGIETVADGLSGSFGLAWSPDGELAVSLNAAFAAPATGSVIHLDMK